MECIRGRIAAQMVNVPVHRPRVRQEIAEVDSACASEAHGRPRWCCATDLEGKKMEVVATDETDLKGQKMEVVATAETDLEAREEIAGRVLFAWKDLRKLDRLLWWEAAPAVDVREKGDCRPRVMQSILVYVSSFLRIN